MRFVTFRHEGAPRAGILDGDTIRALAPGVGILDLLGDDGARLRAAGEAALRSSELVVDLTDADLMAPVPHPVTIRDYMTFEQHVAGVAELAAPGTGIAPQWYEAPAFYFSNPNSVLGPTDDVPIPPGSSLFDFELEVAAVLGRAGRDLTPDDAERCIAGYMLMNDWSARDIQFAEMNVRLGPAKGKDSAVTLGPWLVTPDELEGVRLAGSFDVPLRVRVNGELVGEDTLGSMAFSFGQMIAYASRGTQVRAGDVFGSGTCGGGCLAELWGRQGLDARRALVAGDVVTMEADGLGRQVSRVVAGPTGVDRSLFRARGGSHTAIGSGAGSRETK